GVGIVPKILGSTPSGLRWRGLLAATCAVAAVSGCSDTSFDAQTNDVYDAGVGVNSRGTGVDVLNALIVDNGDGTGTLSATLVLNPGEFDEDQAPTSVTFDDFSVTTLDGQPVDATLSDDVVLQPDESVMLGTDPVATVAGDNVVAGDMVTATFSFDTVVEPIEIDIPVVQRTSTYDGVAEAPTPTPTQTP
ncbi:MAG: hypothetical protein ACJ72B_15140, partial [Ornithinibacter sp.]